MTQAQLGFHNMTSHITQEQLDLQNQLEMHTADFITKPLSNDSPVLFLDNKETPDNPLTDQMEHQNVPSKINMIKWNIKIFLQKLKHLQIMINLLKLHQLRNMRL